MLELIWNLAQISFCGQTSLGEEVVTLKFVEKNKNERQRKRVF